MPQTAPSAPKNEYATLGVRDLFLGATGADAAYSAGQNGQTSDHRQFNVTKTSLGCLNPKRRS